MTSLIRRLAMLLVVVTVGAPAGAAQPAAAPATAPFLTGGIGHDEFTELTEKGASYNLRLLFAEAGGAYIAEVSVKIVAAGGAVIVDASPAGPLLFAQLAPGSYEVRATFDGRTQTKRLSVPAKGRTDMTLRW